MLRLNSRSDAMRRLILGTAIITACSGLGAWAYLHNRHGIEYCTIPVARGNMDATISATGNPNAVVTVQVGSQVSGNIMALYADLTSKLEVGQVMARIDPQLYQARLDAAEAA